MADNGVRSLHRALDILETLRECPTGITELSDRCQLSKSTVHRLLSTLQARGYVVQDPVTEHYGLSLAVIGLGSAVNSHSILLRIADPVMRDLATETGESVRLGVRDDDWVVILHHVEGTRPFHFSGPVGMRLPFHATAIGKVFLASMPADDIPPIARRTGLPAYGPNSIRDVERLIADIAGVQQRGYAINNEEHFAGGRAVAAAIRDAHGCVRAGLVIIGPTDRIREEDLPAWGAKVMAAAGSVSSQLGWRGSPS